MDDFDYALPPDRIARYPVARRSDSRLMVLHRSSGQVEHRRFRDMPELAAPGDLLVVNDSRVFPARLCGRKPTGAPAEVLLVRPLEDRPGAEPADGSGAFGNLSDGSGDRSDGPRRWEALVRPGAKLKPGRVVVVAPQLSVRILDGAPGGARIVALEGPLPIRKALERFGRTPLPPYLGRDDEPLDRERYQTVYARREGSVAAPTAGLHFTDALLGAIDARGVARTAVTLHVGPGTFRPVDAQDPADHRMHAEAYEVPPTAAEAHRRCREAGGRVWAVGTTVARTLETAWSEDGPDHGRTGRGRPAREQPALSTLGRLRSGSGTTDLFIRPPYRFRAADCLVTNFHLPRSTLLMLVSAFGGKDAVRNAYAQAVEAGYRFYSYGDAMAVIP